jgi:hypothetical protein
MTEKELRDFFRDSGYYTCCSSCKTSEKSYPYNEYGHGIWTYHLIQALQGNEPDAIERNGIITSNSLQNYLARQVPLSLRKIRTDLITQTPVLYGSMTKDFIVADVGPLIASRRASGTSAIPTLKRVVFRSDGWLRVKSLSGFKRWHRVPEEVNHYTNRFLNSISYEELNVEVEKAHKILRSDLGYTRRQLDVTVSEGAATIFTPDFSMEITLSLDTHDPSQAILRWELVNIQNIELIGSDRFNRSFLNFFDVIAFDYT